MKWERGIDVARAIDEVADTIANATMNEHNCHMHESNVACNNKKAFQIAVMDSKKKLLNVLTR